MRGVVVAPLTQAQLALGGVLLGMLVTYHAALIAMVHVWSTSATYAHGFLIAPIAVLLVHRLLPRLRAYPQALAPLALVPLLLCGVVWLIATLGAVDVVAQLAVVGMAVSVALFLMGGAWLRIAWFPAAFLFLAVPLGDGLTPLLVERTADFVVAALRVSGIPVFREGTQFVIPGGTWSVVSGCSGIRYLMAILTVGALYAHLHYHAWWKQGVFVGVALLVALIGNWLRAFGIVMLAYWSDMRLALGVDHYLYGWAFFGLLVFALMALGRGWADPPVPAAEAPTQNARHGGVTPGALAVLCLAVLAWPAAAWVLESATRTVSGEPAFDALASRRYHALDAQAAWRAHFAGNPVQRRGTWGDASRRFDWQIAWYPQQVPGAELVNAGNELVHEKQPDWRVLSTTLESRVASTLPTVGSTVLVARDDDAAQLVWHWYWVDGEATADRKRALWLSIRSQLRGRGNPGAMVIVSTPLPEAAAAPAARAALADFADDFATQAHAVLANRGAP